MTDPDLDAIRAKANDFAPKHVIRRDGWCQECGRWPEEKGGPCPLGQLLSDAIRLADALEEVERERDRLRREWPDRNQYEGLTKAMVLLHELRDTLGLTSAGLKPWAAPGRESTYGKVLHHYLHAIETMIGADAEIAKRRAALAAPLDGEGGEG